MRSSHVATPTYNVAITGATGYMGRALSTALIQRGHAVRALIRPGTRDRVARGVDARELDLFDVAQLADGLRGQHTVVHLLGTAHPNPAKARAFRNVDLPAARACIAAADQSGIAHFVYVSVAQPAPVMKAYIAVRMEAESLLVRSGLTATVLRPWYVLGPHHRWPAVLLPLYAFAERVPALHAGARRLGMVRLAQMVPALVRSIEQPPETFGYRVLDVPKIRACGQDLDP